MFLARRNHTQKSRHLKTKTDKSLLHLSHRLPRRKKPPRLASGSACFLRISDSHKLPDSFSPKKIMPLILSCLTSPLPDSTHASDKPRHQFRPSRSVTSTPQKPGLSVAHASQSFGIGCLVCSVTSSLMASRSLASSPSLSSWHYDTHSGRHPNKTSPSGSYSQTAPRSEHTPSPLKHPGSHHTPDAL